MAKKSSGAKSEPVGTRSTASQTSSAKPKIRGDVEVVPTSRHRPSASLDTRVIYCGDNLEQLKKLPAGCVDLIYIDPAFNSNRNYEAFWGETKEKRASEDRHANTQAYIDYMRPLCVELARLPLRQGHARPDFQRK